MGNIVKIYDASSIDTTITGMTFDGSHFWFAGDANNNIIKTDKSFNVIKSFDISGIDVFSRGLAFDGKYLYLCGAGTDKIHKLDMSIKVIKADTLGRHWGMVFNGKYLVTIRYLDHEIYIYDRLFRVVRIFSNIGVTSLRGLTFDGKNYFITKASRFLYKFDSNFKLISFSAVIAGAVFNDLTFDGKYLYLTNNSTNEIIQYAI